MCSNFEPINRTQSAWVKTHFGCELPDADWRTEAYPTYPAPFIYLDEGKPRCALAQFGLVPHWAEDKKKFGYVPITHEVKLRKKSRAIEMHGKNGVLG